MLCEKRMEYYRKKRKCRGLLEPKDDGQYCTASISILSVFLVSYWEVGYVRPRRTRIRLNRRYTTQLTGSLKSFALRNFMFFHSKSYVEL